MVRIEELDRLDDDDDVPPQPVRQRRNQQTTDENATPPATTTENESGSFDEQVNRARQEYQPTPMEKFMAIVKSLILRALIFYFVMSFIRGGNKSTTTTTSSSSGVAGGGAMRVPANNAFPNGTVLDMYVYVNEKNGVVDFSNDRLVWKQEGLVYGDWMEDQGGFISVTTSIALSEKVRLRNASMYIHAYVVPIGMSPSESSQLRIHSSRMLNKFKKKRYSKTKNLITGETSASIEDQQKSKIMESEIVSHWHENLTVSLVVDWTQWTPGAVPIPLNEYISFIPKENTYLPVLFFNDYWNLNKDYKPITAENKTVELTLTFQPLSLFKWQIYAAQSMRNQWAGLMSSMSEEDEDQDALKEAMIETNPYLLALTFVVSILHSIFEFLAFKNDIQFWKSRETLEGLSVRSVFFNVFQSLIVLLYVLDNETNFVIRISVFVGLAIEIWKINKVMDVTIDRNTPFLGIFPTIKFQDKGSYVESSTKIYDKMAFKYLSVLCFPLLGAYAIYSLIYQEHKGVYSFVLSMLYGYLLTFGFIMMTPQLFINYKLKSVAHLPWRMLTYKFLNTFIDDIFAFVIKMPTMYRIGCLRDDVIFFVYLYQRWIYNVDHSRVNEFGFSGEDIKNKKEQQNKTENHANTTSPTIQDKKQK